MDIALRSFALALATLLLAAPEAPAQEGKPRFHSEKELFGDFVDNFAAAAELVEFPKEGKPEHPIVLDGLDFNGLGDSVVDGVRAAFAAGLPLVILGPTPEARGFLDDLSGGEVDLGGNAVATPKALGEPHLEAIGVLRVGGVASTAEFWRAFDAGIGSPDEEEAEDDSLVSSILEWAESAQAEAAPRKAKAQGEGGLTAAPAKRPSIDELTGAVVRKVSFQFDRGSMAAVIKSWAAFSPGQQEDWYIFELTTTSNPLNFATRSAPWVADPLQDNADHCRGLMKSRCVRDRFATQVQIEVASKTEGLELVYYGPDSDRSQDEYTYSSSFSLGGKVTAGYEQKGGAKAGVELSAGASFSRSTKVTIKDATLVGISNPALDLAGWRFEMPKLRAVQDLTEFGGPKMDCDNLLQMPYPVQRGSMESRQYAIFRLPAAKRNGLKSIELTIDFALEESSSDLQNWTAGHCNIFNCACTPRNWVHGTQKLEKVSVSFPLASHVAE